jgi:drug/metabolite transporter (DMT)-like permease
LRNQSPIITQTHKLSGGIFALISAVAFALNLVLAGVSYEYGANIHALNITRAFAFLVSLMIIVFTQGTSFRMPLRVRLMSLLLGILLCAEMYTLMGAIRTIPVALAVLIFYTYPMLIAGIRWIRRTEPFSLIDLVLLVIAFCGLSFVLINSPVTLDTTGIVFALAASVVMAMMLVTSEYSLSRYDNYIVLLHTLIVVNLIIFFLTLTAVDLQWPSLLSGWLAFWGSSLLYVVATFFLFKAVSVIGPLKTAIIDNTAPVWAIIFGYMFLNQVLSLKQVTGAFVVMGAVILLQMVNRKQR